MEAIQGRSEATVAPAPIDTPATYRGALPCADCAAIDWQLDLVDDETFHLTRIYRGEPGEPLVDIGRWATAPEAVGQTLLLHGDDGPPWRFLIDGAALHLLAQDGSVVESKLNYTLQRAAVYKPLEPSLRLRGMYRYFADAGRFRECLTGRSMPVATVAGNRALESAYLAAASEPGREVAVELRGQLALRSPMEGPGPVWTLIPERFIAIFPGESCGTPLAAASLKNTYWRLTRIAAGAAERYDGQRVAHLVFREDGAVSGSDGCNSLNGQFRTAGEGGLDLTHMASTRMACAHGMEQALHFTQALQNVAAYRIEGSHLELLDAAHNTVLRFEAVAL
ncbi:MAG: META domain-containing protein [Halioglobus sp.]|nr:META domain-containing protein [Halioglobus sp.]